MRLLLLTLSSLSTTCLAQRNHIINAIEGSSSNVRGGRNELTVVSVSAPGAGNSNSVDDGATLTVEHHHRSHHQGHDQSHHNNHENSGSRTTVNNFDFYVYSMSYQPEFCRENNEKFDGCRAFNESWEGQLTIHGLWPNVSRPACYAAISY